MTATARILIVDDERANRKLLAGLVEREGWEAVLATGGAEALAVLAREAIDLVLLDLMMPDVDGMAVLMRLREQGALPTLPVVVITAHDERNIRLDALSAGAIDFVVKPVDGAELACRCRTLIELKRLREAASRAAADRAFRESHERVQETIEGLPLYLYRGQPTEDGWFRTDWVMGGVEELVGISLSEYLGGAAWFELVHPDDRAELVLLMQEVLAGTTRAWSVRYRVQHPRRGEVWLANIGHYDPAQRAVMGATLDITNQKRIEEKLVQSQKLEAIGQLAGGVAHDFNNILGVILSYGELLHDEFPAGDERQADMLEILKAGRRAVGLTRQLLTFSRQQPVAPRPTDLNSNLAELNKLLARTVGENIELSLVLSTRPAIAHIDPIQFDQIVLNLAVNARDAMPDGGRLEIALDHCAPSEVVAGTGFVRLTVTDTGDGMDDVTLQRIFEPFFTTKQVGKGTGLGLATCRAITEEADGTIAVQSTLGEGTKFTVDLPLWTGPRVSQELSIEDAAPAGCGECVLVVEDEPALIRVSKRVLEGAGYRVELAADGNEAIRKIDELAADLDLVLSDVVLPGCSGYDVAEHASRVAPDAAIILTSGYLNSTLRRNRRADLPMLWKPVPQRELVRAVGDALAARGSRREAEVSQAPAQAAEQAAPRRRMVAKAAPSETPHGNKVLLIEDDRAIQRVTRRILAAAGYTTEAVGTLSEARQALQVGADEPWAVLCDLSLPDGSGIDLLTWLQSARPGLCRRVFVLTGGATDEASRSFVQSGAFPVLHKPLESRLLLQTLAELKSRE